MDKRFYKIKENRFKKGTKKSKNMIQKSLRYFKNISESSY